MLGFTCYNTALTTKTKEENIMTTELNYSQERVLPADFDAQVQRLLLLKLQRELSRAGRGDVNAAANAALLLRANPELAEAAKAAGGN